MRNWSPASSPMSPFAEGEYPTCHVSHSAKSGQKDHSQYCRLRRPSVLSLLRTLAHLADGDPFNRELMSPEMKKAASFGIISNARYVGKSKNSLKGVPKVIPMDRKLVLQMAANGMNLREIRAQVVKQINRPLKRDERAVIDEAIAEFAEVRTTTYSRVHACIPVLPSTR